MLQGTSSRKKKYPNLLVWVLAPRMKTNDENLEYYYDFTQSIEEFTRTFAALNIAWKWQPVTVSNFKRIIKQIEAKSYPQTPIVFNLCDGDEINGTPGISVIRELEKSGLMYTGADEFFYDITTSKIPMKKMFDMYGVSTPKWKIVTDIEETGTDILTGLKTPLIVKPAVSGGSMGVGIKSVVHTMQELVEQVRILNEGYHGWDLVTGGILIEEFIEGPEFTVLIVGSSSDPAECKVYAPVERVFHQSLPEQEKFLSFDRLWEMYEEETAVGEDEDFYNYHTPEQDLIFNICKLSLDAYCAVEGEGYARIDIRMNRHTGEMFVLEVNAQCGLSEDENFTSIGAILRLSGNTYTQLVEDILLREIKRKAFKVAV